MKLVASMIVHNELDRYLKPCIAHLQGFCDEIRVWDDGSTDDSGDWLREQQGVSVWGTPTSGFYEHEGQARQKLLDFTLQALPTHVLAIDADEFVSDGQALRAKLGEPGGHGVWGLQMQEIWKADTKALSVRQDGGWREHPVGNVYEVPDAFTMPRHLRRHWVIPNRALACGRVPAHVTLMANRSRGGEKTGVEILHFGWACENDRSTRYQRYVMHDSGKFHANTHLESIMWDDSRVSLTTREWPAALDKKTILRRVRK